ncbi:MAG: diguanylate cyclase [Phycisphaeraceae bacterium]|nr:MAG: diguanylate cyclase [Phycisphaeraceae bacterium]
MHRKTRILLAEDNRDHQCLLLLALATGRPSVSVVVASNRDELLAAAQGDTFDCIILDFNLPPYTALDLLGDLESIQPGVPRVVISSSEEQKVVIESIRRGVSDFVPKCDAINGETLWKRIEVAMNEARSRHVERRRMNRRLEHLKRQAETDPLTGVLNRRGAEAVLDSESRRSDRRRSTAIVFIDLDHFKRVNDNLGHAAGDRVLRDAVQTIKQLAGENDIVARWGGEEFLVLRQSSTLTEGWIWSDRVRRAIARDIRLPAPYGPQSASVGVHAVASIDVNVDAITLADRAMYLAKDTGRDRVCTWEMVRAMDIAHDVGTTPGLPPRERLLMLIDRLGDDLGPVQRDHTGLHGWLVRELSVRLARRLLFDERRLDDIGLAAEFHDIGKLGIPESLLALPRLLNPEERNLIDQHARFGADLLRACGASDAVADIVAHHHDWYRHVAAEIRGDANPMSPAHIISGCDAVISMLSERPYAPARTVQQALAELRSQRAQQFHPDVVDAMHTVGQDIRLAA